MTRPGVAVDVVNPVPEAIAERLSGLGAPLEAIAIVEGVDCIERFTRSLCEEASAALLPHVATESLPRARSSAGCRVGIDGLAGDSMSRVISISDREDGTLELTLEPETPRHGATGGRFADDGTSERGSFPTAADLAERIAGHGRESPATLTETTRL